ncbi:MAG: 5-methyltetrahydrofolate--homocysteine methyltransferase [Clostridiales bacterium GWF2_38_85]|nr:MAG: 5-methyltetrahydrofolate--homocysteine methyltransferase [Clostridiales bacterium GWF2_38_85]HBL85002.1 cobalamin-binding protein [Clostridiales bacterium]
MSILNEISEMMQRGRVAMVKELIGKALEEGISAKSILQDALLPGMDIIGEKFKNNQVYVPEVLIAARAMNAGAEILKPYLIEEGVKDKGTVVIGTVKGDLHDIGKNLVKMMMEGKGLKVVDLGVDVSADRFVEAARENNANVIACSALLTTTMGEMKNVVQKVKENKLNLKVIIGGAPITKSYCDSIGADGFSSDAATAAELAMSFC